MIEIDGNIMHAGNKAKSSFPALKKSSYVDPVEKITGIPKGEDHLCKYWLKLSEEVEKLMDEKEAFALLEKTQAASGFVEFLRGGVLKRIRTEEWYKSKYGTFAEFTEAVCGFHVRKAEYSIKIYEFIRNTGIPWEDLNDLHWTKLRELASKIDHEDLAKWLPKAKTMTVLKLREALKADAQTEVGKKEAKVKISFYPHEDQKKVIDEAINKAKSESGSDNDTVALDYICLDYQAGTKMKPSVAYATQMLKKMMAVLGAEKTLSVVHEIFPELKISAALPDNKEAAS